MNKLNEDNLQQQTQEQQQLSQGTKRRSASVGALPREKKHFTSRNESASGISLDVRCACQYFQCDSLIPDRVNPVGSRPESKLGFTNNIPGQEQSLYNSIDIDGTAYMHGRHPDVERISLRSLGGQRSFDRVSTKSFELTQEPIDPEELAKQGLIVCNIVEPSLNEDYIPSSGGINRGISVDRLSQRSFGRRQDFDTISHRSFSGIRKIESRSGSKQDLYVADICLPTAQFGVHSRRSSKTELPHFNIIGATPAPTIDVNKPNFSVYEEFRKNKAGLEEKDNIPRNVFQRQSGIIKQTSLPSRFDQKMHDYIKTTSIDIPDVEPVYQSTTVPKEEPTQIEIKTISIDISTDIVEVRDDPKVRDPDQVVEEGIKAESRSSSPLHSPKLYKRETGIHPDLPQQGSPRSMSPPSSPTSGYFGTLSASPPQSPAMGSGSDIHHETDTFLSTFRQRFSPEKHVTTSAFKGEPTDQTILHATLSIPSGRMSPQSTTYKVSGTATSLEVLNQTGFEHSKGFRKDNHRNVSKSPEGPSILTLPQQSFASLSSNQFDGTDSSNFPIKEKSSFSFFGRKRSKETSSPERLTRKNKEKTANEKSPVKEKSPMREKSPFRFFGKDPKVAKEEAPAREKSPVREKSPYKLFGSETKIEQNGKGMKQEKRGSIFLSPFSKNDRDKSPSRERSPSLSPSAVRRKSSVKPELIMMNSGESNQIMSMMGPTKVNLNDSSKFTPAVASSVHETFSLKVDELDQYAPKPKPNITSSIPTRYSSQQLKVSTINLNEPPQTQSIDTNQKSTARYTLPGKSLSTTSSHPNLSSISPFRHDDSISREPSIAPSFTTSIAAASATTNITPRIFAPVQIAPNLVSVAIGIPHQTSQAEGLEDEHAYDTLYFEGGDTKLQSRNVDLNQVISQQRQSSEIRQIPSRPPSERKLKQSSLLRRKNYFDRTQSQDRAHSSQDSGNESMIGRLSKTVSFDFVDQRSSRFDQHENSKSKATTSLMKKDWLDKSYFMRDHEYEPIGEPQDGTTSQNASILKKESSPQPTVPSVQISQPMDVEQDIKASAEAAIELLQKDLEDRYLSSGATTPRSDSRADTEIHTSQVDTSALEELPLKAESRRKGFMASAQDRSRRFKAGIRNQAGKMKTKVRGIKKPAIKKPTIIKKETVSKTEIGDVLVVSQVVTETQTLDETSPTSEPKTKRRFSNIKMPDMPKFKSPDMSKLKAKATDLKKIEFKKPEFKKPEFKRPEFTKIDMSKFKIPEKFSSLKLKRSRSFKEGETSIQTGESGTTPESVAPNKEKETTGKKKFEFSFGTYPRALRRKKIRDSIENIAKPTDLSTQPSTETAPSIESTQPIVQRGTRDKGPVGSRWADKFSDVSYGGDSESGRFQRYGSEIESFERESSVERRMKDDLIAQEESELALLGDPGRKQFVEFDEENREIHKISRDREEEFKHRRPMIHQDSNISEESRDVGWSEKDAIRNKMLRRAEMESESYSNNYPSEEGLTNQETQSTGSSTFKKGVIEEIDDDEFFLRKRGISQDNIEIRQYISTAIREGFDNPINTLEQLGSSQGEYPDSMIGISSDNVGFGYNIPRTPPRKPKRQKPRYNDFARNVGDSQEISQEFDIDQKENYGDNISLPQTGSDYFKNIQPSRPLRKSKKGYSQDSQSDIPYFEDIDKDFYQHKEINLEDPNMMVPQKYDAEEELHFQDMSAKPVAPKRRKKRQTESEDRELIMNGFGGRSVSNSYLQDNMQLQDMIVYRTEHEYVIPLAKPESYEGTPDMNDARSTSRTNNEEDDRTSRGAESYADEGLVIAESRENEPKFEIEMEESHGYAVVRKDPPPRPPPPSRHKRSPGRFATMPLSRKSPPPERPKRNYSTIAPERPPPPRKQRSLENLEKASPAASDVTQYEELDIEENLQRRPESPSKLKSGEIINKMKHRPLPPPPRPPREKKDKSKHKPQKDDMDDHEDEGDHIKSESTFEVEISTQTDPLPDDFIFEEFEITDDMKIIEPRNSKTLEDLLRDEDREMEGVKWNGDDSLTRGIQRFRESTQRSFSEKSRASSAADRSKSHSRPQTPAAIVVEKRVPTPIPNSKTNETMLEASLTVQPIDDMDLADNITKTSLQDDESFNDSASYQASTVKSAEERSAEREEERLNDFAAIEQLAREEEEEREKLREEMRRIQQEKEEEEERLIMEKIRELQKLEEEEERKTMEKLQDLEILEQQEKRRLQKQAEEEERKQREEQDRRILEKIKELEEQEEDDRRIMEKLRQLEKEFSAAEEAEKQEIEKQETRDSVEEQELLAESLEAPSRPPRKRSSVPNIPEEDQPKEVAHEATTLSPISEKPIVDISSVPSQPSLPSHMALADLEVERLRVHALQAGHIMVSNLHGNQIAADELECKAGNLVVRNLELPPGFIEDIVERVRSTERTHVPVETQTAESEETQSKSVAPSEQTEFRESRTQRHPQHMYEQQRPFIPEDLPPRPPLPPMFPPEYLHSIPPAAFYQLRNPDEEEYQPNLQAPRRRRHYRRRDSSSDDDHHRRRSRSRRSPDTSVAQLGGQFLQACGTSLLRRLSQIANAVHLNVKEGGERNIGILIAMFILMTLGFLLMAMSGKNIHHHHWDFFNPPNNEGRKM